METSSLLSLPYIMPSQAQKHVTHNEAIRSLDAIVQLSARTADQTSPPQNPQEGDRYIIADAASGPWENRAGKIAAFQDGAWAFFTPREGWICWVEDQSQIMVFSANNWQGLGPAVLEQLGINTDADSVNRLAVKSDSVLFSFDETVPGSGDCRLTLNKSGQSATASMLFKNQYSARAEVGLTGDDALAFKVSPDGVNFENAMTINPADGNVAFGGGNDFDRSLTISGSNPFLRISNSSETEAGLEIVDAQAVQGQSFQLAYDCGSQNAIMRVNGQTALEITGNLIRTETNLGSQKGICGDYVYSRSRVFISSNYTGQPDAEYDDPTIATNLDHIWNDDAANEWHFCSDTAYKSTGNATIRAAAFTTTSDYRLKENVADIAPEEACQRVLDLRPVTFNWSRASRLNAGMPVQGFVAHEVQKVLPSAVRGAKDAMADDGSRPVFQSINQDQMLPVVVSALQWAISRIEILEKKVIA